MTILDAILDVLPLILRVVAVVFFFLGLLQHEQSTTNTIVNLSLLSTPDSSYPSGDCIFTPLSVAETAPSQSTDPFPTVDSPMQLTATPAGDLPLGPTLDCYTVYSLKSTLQPNRFATAIDWHSQSTTAIDYFYHYDS